jgi:hypothetical protein
MHMATKSLVYPNTPIVEVICFWYAKVFVTRKHILYIKVKPNLFLHAKMAQSMLTCLVLYNVYSFSTGYSRQYSELQITHKTLNIK